MFGILVNISFFITLFSSVRIALAWSMVPFGEICI